MDIGCGNRGSFEVSFILIVQQTMWGLRFKRDRGRIVGFDCYSIEESLDVNEETITHSSIYAPTNRREQIGATT